MLFLLSVSILFLQSSDAKFLNTKKVVHINSIKRCEEYPDTPEIYVSLSKHNRTTTLIKFNATLNQDIDDNLSLDFELRRWGDGGWKHNTLRIQKKKACSTLKFILGDIFSDFMTKSNRDPNCPIKKGFVGSTQGFLFDISKCPILIMEGKVQSIIKFLNPKGEVIVCNVNIVEVKNADA